MEQGADLAAEVLAAVRRSARGSTRGRGAAKGKRSGTPSGGVVYTGASEDERDPQLARSGVSDLIESRGWETRAQVAAVMGRWAELAGDQLSSHVAPARFDADSGLLTLQADSTAWATQVRILVPELLRRMDEEVGNGLVRQIEVLGPRPPRRGFGKLSVPGRGPRDTYG